jgi:uncharacterized protein involved in oxidation of intracellular sulfur
VTFLFILNDAPYASERDYNALRLATSLAAAQDHAVEVFLLGDGVCAAVANQPVPEGAHDIAWMLRRLAAAGSRIQCCRTCMEARGILPEALIGETTVGTLERLAALTVEVDKVLVF